MQVWELATSLDISCHVPIVFLFLGRKARGSIMELDVTTLNTDDGMGKKELDMLFLEDTNQLAFLTYNLFKQY